MGFVQAWAVEGCLAPRLPGPTYMRQRVRVRSAPDDAPGTRPLPPPPHTVASGALSKIFPHFLT